MYRDSLKGTRYKPNSVTKTKTVFNMPLKLKKPTLIFTSSLTDFFHEDCDNFRQEAWDIIRKTPHHTYQILTKRPERIMQCLPEDWGNGWEHVWIGVSVGNKDAQWMIPMLANCINARNKFLSLEPLLEDFDLRYDDMLAINWVIIGGESGNLTGKYKARPIKASIYLIVEYLYVIGVPIFVKQLGTVWAQKYKFHNDRHGRNMSNFPRALQVREFPKAFDKHFSTENNI